MFVINEELIKEEKKFPCKSNKLKKFLVEIKKIPYISKKIDEKSGKIIWYFIKTEEFNNAFQEWRDNKKNGTLVFPPKEVSHVSKKD